MSGEIASAADTHAYARFTRRLQAVLLDSIVFMLILAGALIVATSFGSDNIARILGFVFVATGLLYEPVLVSTTGGTVGHWLCNLRVVDDAGGNIGFGKAIFRTIVKAALGWYSFITMAVTSRHQAAHDLITQSTVQMRDLSSAKPSHFRSKSEDFSNPNMPSRLRRIVVIIAYAIGWYAINSSVLIILSEIGALSRMCTYNGIGCSWVDTFAAAALGLLLVAGFIFILAQGWRGRLWGARRKAL